MQTDNLLAPLVQLGKALMACIMVAHAKTMRCFAKTIKTSVCRVYSFYRHSGRTQPKSTTRSTKKTKSAYEAIRAFAGESKSEEPSCVWALDPLGDDRHKERKVNSGVSMTKLKL